MLTRELHIMQLEKYNDQIFLPSYKNKKISITAVTHSYSYHKSVF